ncbi:MAG: helix-turn-helix domain-containing protein [Candidatus Acidiferrales bacterium]
MSEILERQNSAIISLLARSTIGVAAISKIVCGGKRNPNAYLNVYNSLNGTAGVTDLAKLAGVSQPTMSVVLQSWEEQGIIYNVGTDPKPRYHRLLHLPPPKVQKSKPQKDKPVEAGKAIASE